MKYRLLSNGSSLDFRILPYIDNEHVATVVNSDFIYMNGLYNGENSALAFFFYLDVYFSMKGTSHRVRIPNTIN